MFRIILGRILDWLQHRFMGGSRPYRTVFLEELPDCLDERVLYVLGEGGHLWSVAMLCQCGCGETLHMSLHQEGRPRWELTYHSDGTVSLWPSIWRKYGCRSHFFLA
ncbi:MAG: DUF6527 family protein [Actinobacteria bacterium]|nr:DUF6527 family protein [Actinomycetota bacterium]